jgi:hypothetical protein
MDPIPTLPPAALPTSTSLSPKQRQEDAMTRFTQVRDDPKAVEGLLKEVTGNLLVAERLISHLQAGRHLAQRGHDSSKASMIATNSNLLKVLPTPILSRILLASAYQFMQVLWNWLVHQAGLSSTSKWQETCLLREE